jgi:hexosaminidase
VAAGGATLRAATVWGALRGLETFSQLARHTWTTNAAGAVNASFNEVCEVAVVDAPRFPMRSLMIDTARHFMPLSVIKQVIELASYLKLNSLRLHLIDTDSWALYVPELPQVTNASAYSPRHVYYPNDLAELVAFGRARGVIVWPEVDFPMHDGSILASIPELGCLSPDGSYRMYIDPTYPLLWETMGKIWGPLNAIFPPETPFHMGGDEVDRNAWATCPSVIAWAATAGCAPGNVANCVTDWFYTKMYNFLAAPPYNRVVFAWEDATDAVNASWVGASTGGLVLEQWNGSPGEWRSGVCDIAAASNAGVLVSGPFMDVLTETGKDYGAIPYNSFPEKNYADIFNLTCG